MHYRLMGCLYGVFIKKNLTIENIGISCISHAMRKLFKGLLYNKQKN